jgi:hypothetical protein
VEPKNQTTFRKATFRKATFRKSCAKPPLKKVVPKPKQLLEKK